MPFDPKTAKKAGKKSKRGSAKKRRAFHQRKDWIALWKSTGWSAHKSRLAQKKWIQVIGTLFNDIYLKNRSVRDKCTLEKLKEKKEDFFNQDPYPTK